MSQKEINEALLKLAEKQQKIIVKMAQQMGMPAPAPMSGATTSWADVSTALVPWVQEAAKLVGAKGTYGVLPGSAGVDADGSLMAKISHPTDVDSNEYYAVSGKLKEIIPGKTLRDLSGNNVTVKSVGNLIGVAG